CATSLCWMVTATMSSRRPSENILSKQWRSPALAELRMSSEGSKPDSISTLRNRWTFTSCALCWGKSPPELGLNPSELSGTLESERHPQLAESGGVSSAMIAAIGEARLDGFHLPQNAGLVFAPRYTTHSRRILMKTI